MRYKHIVKMGRLVLPWRENIFSKRYLETERQKALLSAADLVITEKIDGLTTSFELEGLTFHTEDLHYKHSIVYDRVPVPSGQATPWLICFDISEGGIFIPHNEMVTIAEVAGYPTPPVIHKGPVTIEKLWELTDRTSGFASTSKIEGLVLKSQQLRIWGKLVTDEFLSEMGEHWRDRRPWIANKMCA